MRTFVAIDISPEIRRRLEKLERDLEPHAHMLRWTDPEKIHLTLQFLGEVAADKIPEITQELGAAVQSISPFDISVAGVGAFPSPRSLRVLWVGIKDDSGSLSTLQHACQSRLCNLGFEPEARDFNPHLTLARAKGESKVRGLEQLIDAHNAFNAGQMRVSEIILYESQLSPKGPAYTPRARLKLRA